MKNLLMGIEFVIKMKNITYQLKKDPWSSHSKIVQWINAQNEFQEVVEVGSATGIIGKQIINRKFCLKGIEINEDWANEAKKFYDEIIVSSVENVSGSFFENADCVIFGDVLEHLAHPLTVLKKVVDSSPKKSYFIISVPNVANIWIRVQLLFGRFDYTEKGILDKTHLRFFTHKSLLDLISKSDLFVHEIQYTPIPMNLIHPFFEKIKFGRYLHARIAGITNLFPKVFSYQMIVYCKKQEVNHEKNLYCASCL